MKLLEELPLLVALQWNEMYDLRLNPEKVLNEPRFGVLPFARSAGKQDAIRFGIADPMKNVVNAGVANPRHFIERVDDEGRASRHRAENTGPNVLTPEPFRGAT